jgi:hypothetical protein
MANSTTAVKRKLKGHAYDRYGLLRGHCSGIDAARQRHAAFAIDLVFNVLMVSTSSSTGRKSRRSTTLA